MISGDICDCHNSTESALGRSFFPDEKLGAQILITVMRLLGSGWARTQSWAQGSDSFSHLAHVALQSVSPSPPESVVEEERPSGLGGNGKQRAEEKDLSGPYVSRGGGAHGLGWADGGGVRPTSLRG